MSDVNRDGRTRVELEAGELGEALEALNDGIAVFDAAHRLSYFNRRFAEAFAEGADRLIPGMSWQAFFAHATAGRRAQGLEQIDAAINSGVECSISVEAQWPGKRFVQLRLHQNNRPGFVLTQTDISEQRPAEKLRAEADSLLREVLDACATSIFMSRISDGAMLYQTPQSVHLFGEVSNARSTYVDIKDRERYLAKLLPAGALDDYQVRLRDKTGRVFPANVSGRLVQYRGEDVIISSIQDHSLIHGQREEIEKLNQRLLDAINSLSEGFVLYDRDDRLVIANKIFRDINAPIANLLTPGTAHQDIIAKAQEIKLIPSIEDLHERFSKELTTGRWNRRRQTEIEHQNGNSYLVSIAPTEEGGAVLTWRDISERKRAEELFRERIADAIEALQEGFCLLDQEYVVRLANRAFIEFFLPHRIALEARSAAVAGMGVRDVTREAVANGHFEATESLAFDTWTERFVDIQSDRSQSLLVERRDGHVIETTSSKTALGGYLLISRDITEDRRAEKAQQEADELVRTIVASSPTTFLVSRISDGEIVYISPQSRERFGHITSTLSFFLDPRDRERYLEALLPTGQVDNYRVRFRRHDGSVMDGLTSARVVDYKGEALIVSSTRDITDQLKMEAELERQKEIAHQNEKLSALGELLAGVAHELNNPLSVIIGQALMLREDLTEPRIVQRIDRLANAADRSAKIVRTFLAMARQKPTALAAVPLNVVVETALDVASLNIQDRNVFLRTELSSDAPVVLADEDQITQVIINLLTNAQQALRGQDKALLSILTRSDPMAGEAVVIVADNGPGVPDELKKRIFEPFFTTKDVGTGTGVGLALSYRIVTSHSGTIVVDDAPDGGAVFSVTLPLIDETAREDVP
ncbi:MAG: PAS-domain containing protein [Pseudomonadota bacterium]